MFSAKTATQPVSSETTPQLRITRNRGPKPWRKKRAPINGKKTFNAAVYQERCDAQQAINLLMSHGFNIKKVTIMLVGCLALTVAVAGQDLPSGVLAHPPQLPGIPGVPLKAQSTPAYSSQTGNFLRAAER